MDAETTITVLGTVQSGETGRALRGITVEAHNGPPLLSDSLGEATTNDNGEFSIVFRGADLGPGPAPPEIRLRLIHEDTGDEFVPDDRRELDPDAEEDQDIDFGRIEFPG